MQLHPVPRWLNEQFVHRLLAKLSNDIDFNIHDLNIVTLSRHSDPFASPIFRLTVTSSSRYRQAGAELRQSFVLKVPAAQRTTAAAATVDNDAAAGFRVLFDNEIRFYCDTLEEMQRLLKHADLGVVELGARVLHYSSGDEAVLVLEDLAADGFAAPQRPLALDAAISTVFKLAKWHAASIYMANESHNLQTSTGIFSGGDQLRFMHDNFAHFVKVVQTWSGCEVYAQKFAALLPHFEARGREIFTAKDDGFNVLNHGALSLSNLLVREDERGLNVKFIDYQYCVWATPAIDLLYALHLVCQPDVRAARRSELIQFYYKELTRTLLKMGYLRAPPTLQQLQIELLQNGFLEVIVTTCLLPFHVNGGLETHDLSAPNLPLVRQAVYADEHYRALVKAQLPHFLHKGFLN